MNPVQGDIWWAEPEEDKRRPVLVVTRDDAIPILTWITIAPITRSTRNIATEVPLGHENGLRHECVATFDNLRPMRRSHLIEYVGHLRGDQGDEICRALSALADC